MAILEITRSNEFVDRYRKIKIFLNDKKFDSISNGETKSFEINEGTHTLQAKIDWCSSNKLIFSIGNSETKSFNLTSFAMDVYVGGLVGLYYITFGANKYLNLQEKTI